MDVYALLNDQAGVISRRQALAAGLAPHDVRRLLRRRGWAAVHAGVYVDHTGQPSWLQRAWAGVLFAWPACLADESAMRAAEGPGRHHDPAPIVVAIESGRSLLAPADIIVRPMVRIGQRAQWNTSPPRLRYEEAALNVALRAESDFDAIAALSAAVQSRRTTARRLLDSAQARPRMARRAWVEGVLADVASGNCSVLEHGYFDLVERAHRLPVAERQVRDRVASGGVYRDVAYDCGLIVELDGRLFHDSATARDRDFERDLATATTGRQTVRLSWGQVFDRPCLTAERLVRLLRQRGWTGQPATCGPLCAASASRSA